MPERQPLARAAFQILFTVMFSTAHAATPQLTPAYRHRIIDSIAANVKQHYFDKQVAEIAAGALLAHEKAGDYDALLDGQAFANLLARHLVEASRDLHFTVEYTPNVFPDFLEAPAARIPGAIPRRHGARQLYLRKGRDQGE